MSTFNDKRKYKINKKRVKKNVQDALAKAKLQSDEEYLKEAKARGNDVYIYDQDGSLTGVIYNGK